MAASRAHCSTPTDRRLCRCNVQTRLCFYFTAKDLPWADLGGLYSRRSGDGTAARGNAASHRPITTKFCHPSRWNLFRSGGPSAWPSAQMGHQPPTISAGQTHWRDGYRRRDCRLQFICHRVRPAAVSQRPPTTATETGPNRYLSPAPMMNIYLAAA